MALQEADRLVIFGITGDLAKMTLPSLYRLERRGMLKVPIITVAFDDWTREQLINHARESIRTVEGNVDEAVFTRLAERLSYVHGDFNDPSPSRGARQGRRDTVLPRRCAAAVVCCGRTASVQRRPAPR